MWDAGMEDFKDCTQTLEVDDIRGIGPNFTWWNRQSRRPIHKKLDRALGNADWFSHYPHAQATFAPRGMSDHALVLLNSGIPAMRYRKHFQFFNHLMLAEGFDDCVQNAWGHLIHGNPFFIFTEKLKRTKKALIALNISFGNLSSSVSLVKDALHQVQSFLSNNPQDSDLIDQEKSCLQQLWTALDKEETLLQQKSRSSWLSLGDRNSSYFSNMVKCRWNSNKVFSIQNSAGDIISGQEAVEEVAVDYFKNLFCSPLICHILALMIMGVFPLISSLLIKLRCYLLLLLTMKFTKPFPL